MTVAVVRVSCAPPRVGAASMVCLADAVQRIMAMGNSDMDSIGRAELACMRGIMDTYLGNENALVESGLLGIATEMARLRWMAAVSNLKGESAELELLVDELDECVGKLEPQARVFQMMSTNEHDVRINSMLQQRSRVVAQACHASVVGGRAVQTAVIPSRDLFTLYSLSGGGCSCRTEFADAIKHSLGYSEEWLPRPL